MPAMMYLVLGVLAVGLVIGAAMFVQRLRRERQRNDEFSARLAVELQLAAAKAGPMRQREFRIAFAQQRDAAAAATAIRRNAYRVTVRHDESRDRWVVLASRRMTDNAANATSTYFEQVASRHSGEYEGTTVAAEPPSSSLSS